MPPPQLDDEEAQKSPRRQQDAEKNRSSSLVEEKQQQQQQPPSSSSDMDISSVHGADGGGVSTHPVSVGDPMAPQSSANAVIPDEFYDRLPPRRKMIIVAVLSYCSLLAPVSSTTVLSAIPEVAAEYGASGSVVDVSNALYTLFMGISPIVWGPLSEVYCRRMVSGLPGLLIRPWLTPFSVFAGGQRPASPQPFSSSRVA